jgi:hypothetical protein
MCDFLVKEMHFSQQTTHIRTTRLVSNHRQRVCYRMLNPVCRSDAQAVNAPHPWNKLENRNRCFADSTYFEIELPFLSNDI